MAISSRISGSTETDGHFNRPVGCRFSRMAGDIHPSQSPTARHRIAAHRGNNADGRQHNPHVHSRCVVVMT